MFKPWKTDKRKIKATFLLHFHATEVPKLKKPLLLISLVPEDIGKPTFKLEKAEVHNGLCSWENPVYVTVKFSKDPKTGKLHEKLYHFIVSNGSSKSGYLGESSVDLADFAEVIEPTTVPLPLKFANSGVVLHLTINRILEDEDGGRIVESNESYEGWNNEDCDLPGKHEEDESSTRKTSGCGSEGGLRQHPEGDIKVLTRNAQVAELELHSLKKQIVKEGKRVQELSNQIECIREERDALLAECEALRSSRGATVAGVGSQASESKEMKQLKEQVRIAEQSKEELMDALRDADEMMKEKDSQLSALAAKLAASRNAGGHDDDSEHYILQKKITDLSEELDAYREDREKLEDYVEKLTQDNEALKGENADLATKIKREHELLLQSEGQASELSCIVKDLESQIWRMEEVAENQTRELSESKASVEELGRKVEGLEKELEKQALLFEDDLNSLAQAKIQLEQRAVAAEDSLRRTKWKNTMTAERLQDEIKRISVENEKVMAAALAETEALRSRNILLESELKENSEALAVSRREEERLLAELEMRRRQQEQAAVELDRALEQLACEQQLNQEREEAAARELASLQRGRNREQSMDERKDNDILINRLERKIDKLSRDSKTVLQENSELRDARDESKDTIERLQSELKRLRSELSNQNKSSARVEALSQELEQLRERNRSMDYDLKEMQERYSGISLKFAEVESERQQLVKTIRTLNGRKN